VSAAASDPRELRRVIVASSLGTTFEWYDFFLYGAVAKLLSEQFFPTGEGMLSWLLVLATFGAGFAVRPLGALVFGRLGDRTGRKKTFLITVLLMGIATAAMGLLPTYATAGLLAPLLLVALRLLQGLALGGEYGGAAVYVAEHAPEGKRALYTSFIQLSGALGFLLALAVVLGVQWLLGDSAWRDWAWRLPFLFSILLLATAVYMRLRLHESPVFESLRQRRALSAAPIRESFRSDNLRRMLIALFAVAGGQTVTWFTAQFTSLYLMQRWAGMEDRDATALMAVATLLCLPLFVLSGWLADRYGRRPVLMTGYLLSLLLTVPVFHAMAAHANPGRTAATEAHPVVVTGSDCRYEAFAKTQASACGRALAVLTARGVSYSVRELPGDQSVTIAVGATPVVGDDGAGLEQALTEAGYLSRSPVSVQQQLILVGLAMVLIAIAALTYGPTAAILVELFPSRIRYTSMSLPYHLGTGYIGGFQPFMSQYLAARSGNPFGGLGYTLAFVALGLVLCLLALPETRGRRFED
jgi:MFS family permease